MPRVSPESVRSTSRVGLTLDHRWLGDGPSWNLRAAGGMISTAAEMARFALALDAETILSEDARSAFLAVYVRASPRGTRVVGHPGSNGIFNAALIWDLDERIVVSVLTSVAEHSAVDVGRDLFTRAVAVQAGRSPNARAAVRTSVRAVAVPVRARRGTTVVGAGR